MDISVVVPTFNRREIVQRTLQTLFTQDASPGSYEVLVVVDGSTDGTAEALRSLRPACCLRVIEQANRGPASARNTGYKAAQSDLVLFLDDDMFCGPGLIGVHVAAHRRGDRVVAIGSILASPDSPSSLAAECIVRAASTLEQELKQTERSRDLTDRWFFSNASLFRNLLDEVGGFDEAFRHREDLELGIRLASAGVRPEYISNAPAFQYFTKTSADLIREAEAFAYADEMFARKHPEALIEGQFSWLANEPRWKRNLVRMAAARPVVADYLLALICSLGEALFRVAPFRNMGVHALQLRRRIRWSQSIQTMNTQRS